MVLNPEALAEFDRNQMLIVNPVAGIWSVLVTEAEEGISEAVPSGHRHTHVVGVSEQKPPDVTMYVCMCVCMYVCGWCFGAEDSGCDYVCMYACVYVCMYVVFRSRSLRM
jgi:hypothetical protein